MYGVGIDLGTSFAAAAVASAGSLDMVRLGGQAMVTPSVAYLDEKGVLLTGEAADRLGLRDPSRVAREFKRRLGDPTPMILAGSPHSPTALMAALLRAVLDTVSQAQGSPPDRIVLTHPAVWGPYRREQFAAIPQLAGLPCPRSPHADQASLGSGGPAVHTTTEPVAAATYYCSTRPLPPDGLLAVYDLGGGTFDSAVVRNGRDGLEIVGTPEGIEWLGGADFDQAILDHVDRQLGGAITALDPADPATATILATLHRDCTLTKEALSTRAQADVTVPLPDGDRHVTVARDAFEQMITPSLETTVEAFRRTLTAASITPQDLTAVLLVGGSSQIPRVTEVLRAALRRPIMINTHPKHAVALGAAMLSADIPPVHGIPAPQRSEQRATSSAMPAPARPETSADPAGVVPVEPAGSTPTVSFATAAPHQLPKAPKGAARKRGEPPATPAPVRRRSRSLRVLLPIIVVFVATVLGASFLLAPRLSSGGAPLTPVVAGTSPETAHPSPEAAHPSPETAHPSPETAHPSPEAAHHSPSCNAALHRPATASSVENAGSEGDKAVDDNIHTRWSSAYSDPQWLQVDLGNPVGVCGVSIRWEAAYATAFEIQLSTDGTNWTSVYSITTGAGGTQYLAVSGTGRYVRMYGTARATGFGYSIWEFAVYTTVLDFWPS